MWTVVSTGERCELLADPHRGSGSDLRFRFAKGVEPGPQLRFGPARNTDPNLNIRSGSCPNLVQHVREPDHGQSRSWAFRFEWWMPSRRGMPMLQSRAHAGCGGATTAPPRARQ